MFHQIMTLILPVGWILCLYWIRHRENNTFRQELKRQELRVHTLEMENITINGAKFTLKAENCILQAVHKSDMAVIEQKNDTIKDLDTAIITLMNGDPELVNYDTVADAERRSL